MTIKLEVNGIQYTNFISASCDIRLDALSNTFSFEIAAAEDTPLPFGGREPCKVLVNDQLVLTGNIEVVAVDYNENNHIIFIEGRDKTGDLLDSSLNHFEIKSGITLKELIEKVLKQIGLEIDVIDLANPDSFNSAEDIISAEDGDNAFDFIEQYARKRQVLLTSDENGNVVINTNSGETALGAIQHKINSDDNNVLSSNFNFDTTQRFKTYKIVSQLNPTAINNAGETSNSTIVAQRGEFTDPNDIRKGRQFVLVSEVTESDTQCKERAKWEADIRRGRGLVYSATVSGYRVDLNDDKSDLWRTNKLYQVTDDFLEKQQQMLCNSVTYTLDLFSGQQTTLSFVDENMYTLNLTTSSTSKVADNFLSISERLDKILSE